MGLSLASYLAQNVATVIMLAHHKFDVVPGGGESEETAPYYLLSKMGRLRAAVFVFYDNYTVVAQRRRDDS